MKLLIESLNLEGLKEAFKSERKNAIDEDLIITKVDTLIRERGLRVIQACKGNIDSAKKHFHFVMQAVTAGVCSKITAVNTLQDFFETSSIEMCKLLFDIVEDNMSQFKQSALPDATQNLILRLCNDLLKRLSRTAETSFCGRIMFFLSRFLPLAEKSGLNLMGYFNTQNVTVYDEGQNETESLIAATSINPPKQEDEDMEVGEIADDVKEIQVTPEMYRQFWSLQKFLSNPALVFDKDKYPKFKKDISSVFAFLNTNKLEKSSQEDEEMERNSKREKLASDDLFFSKYLTSPKLLSLQLNDSQLRRYFLLQCLIIFQYLVMSEERFKTGVKKLILNEEQLKFVNDCEDKCYKLLGETMPKGSNFSAICKKILQRENEWSNWKNNNCPDFCEKADKAGMQMYKKRPRVGFNPESRELGTPDLTNLWKHDYDILELCKSSKRKFIPSLSDFIRDPLTELDPEQQVEDEYKSVNNAAFQWRASRLLMMKSPQYMSRLPRNSDPTSNMKDFLEKTIYNTAKQIDEFKPDIEAREQKEADARKKVEESLKRKLDEKKNLASTRPFPSSPNPEAVVSLTDDHLNQLAVALSSHVKKVAKVFDIDEKETEEALKKTDKTPYCYKLLKDWAEKSKDRGSKTLLLTLISDVEVVEIATRSLKKILTEESNS